MSKDVVERPPWHAVSRGYLPVVVDVETGGFNAETDALLKLPAVTLRMDDNGFLHPHPQAKRQHSSL